MSAKMSMTLEQARGRRWAARNDAKAEL